MNNLIKKLDSIRIRVPDELRKKEYITLGELFKHDENANIYQEIMDDFIQKEIKLKLKNELSIKSDEIEKNLKIEANKKLEEYKKETKEIYEELAKQKVSLVDKLLEREKELSIDLKNRLDKNENLLINLKKDQEKIYEDKLQILNKKHEAEIIEVKREAEGKQTSTEIGEFGEDQVISALRQLFPEDHITKPNSALGEADVLHKLSNGNTFYYEVKNRKNWNMANLKNFSDKVRKRDDAAYFFISKALPKKTNDFVEVAQEVFYDSLHDIYITSFKNYLPLVFAIRKLNIKFNKKLDQMESSNEINQRILNFVNSSEFQNYFTLIKDKFANLEKVFKNIQRETQNGMRLANEIDITIINFKIDIESKIN